MKKILLLILPLLVTELSCAQEQQYSMKEAVLGLQQKLAPENVKQTSWIPHTNSFTTIQTTGDDQPFLEKITVPNMKKERCFSLSELNQELFQKDSLDKLPQLHWLNTTTIYFKNATVLYRGKKEAAGWHFSKWVELPEGTDNFYVDKTKQRVAYSKANNLYLADSNGNVQAVTEEKDKDIVSGQLVSRQEFGIDRGVFFSPQGKYVAFYQKDESQVADYPIIDWSVLPAKNKNIKYPMAGDASQEVHLGVYNPETQETVFMQTGDNTDHYLTNVSWGPNDKYLYIAILQRDQKQLSLNKYNAKTGEKIKTLFTEKDDKYVHPQEPLHFLPGHNDQFIWWSERDGYMHLYRYNTNGELINQVTSGDWVVNAIKGENAKRNELIISTSKISPMDKDIFAVNWKTGKLRRLDREDGMHSAQVNDKGTYWIDRFSNYNTPRKIRVVKTHSKWEKELLEAKNPLKDYAQPQIKELTLTAADGKTPLYGRLILPPDFDKSQKYPVIVYLYNGPGVQLLHNSFPESGNLWYDYMAQRGYIIFTMDGRGSANRGLEFEQATYRHLGTQEMNDQLKGVEYLKSLPYVDNDRLGVHGWSFGGFMTTSLMLRHPGVFKAAVAGGPVMDWRMYEIMYTERYMDRPQDNPEGYKEAQLFDKAGNLEDKLLLIHGAQDSTVVWQHSMKFLRESVKANAQVDYYVYPAYPHNVRGKDRIHLMQKVTNYFDDYLKGEL